MNITVMHHVSIYTMSFRVVSIISEVMLIKYEIAIEY